MLSFPSRALAVSAFLLRPLLPAPVQAQMKAVEEVRAAIRQYDAAIRRADRLANVRSGRTAFDSLAPVLDEERIRTYGDHDLVAVHTTLLTIGGRYSGREERGQYRATAIWVRRDVRWRQVASQLTPVMGHGE